MAEAIIYVVDSDANDRRSAVELIDPARDTEVRAFRSPGTLLNEIEPGRPGCVLSEVHLSELTGLELQNLLLRDHPAVAMVFMTHDRDPEAAVQAMKQGAVDYLQKPVRPVQLRRALNEAIALVSGWHAFQREREQAAHRLSDLTPRECQMVPYLAYGWTNKQIAAKLHVSIRTVEHYRRCAFEKMNVSSPLGLLRPWMLFQADSPRCLELFRHNLESQRPLPRCPQPGCAASGASGSRPQLMVPQGVYDPVGN